MTQNRKEAKSAGQKRYFTGKPCTRGHIAERLVSNFGCLACVKEVQKLKNAAFYRKHAERIKSRVRGRWRTDAGAKAKDKANRDKRRDKIRAYDRMRAKRDEEKKKVIIARWIANNRERYKELRRACAHRRRALISGAGGSHTPEDIKRIMTGQKGRCWWCNKKFGKRYHVDHRIPIAKGGTNDPSNLVIACVPCNKSKSAKLPWQFSGRLF